MTPDLRSALAKSLNPRLSNRVRLVNAQIAEMRAEREHANRIAREHLRVVAR